MNIMSGPSCLLFSLSLALVSCSLLIAPSAAPTDGSTPSPIAKSSELTGEVSKVTSPDGVWTIEIVDASSPDAAVRFGGNHVMLLRHEPSGEATRVHAFDRGVDVLWAPNSGAFAVTDHEGSNSSTCYVFFPRETPRVDVGEMILARLKGMVKLSGFPTDHIYIEATKWLDSSRLRVRAWGYDAVDPGCYEYTFDYELRGKLMTGGRSKCDE